MNIAKCRVKWHNVNMNQQTRNTGSCNAVSRRSFIAASGAFAVSKLAGGVLPERPELVVGILSDTHVTDRASTLALRRALRYFRERLVDAVVIAGDLTDHGLVGELREVAEAWCDVFPDDFGRDGRHVERIFVAGNHDVRVFDNAPCIGANMGFSNLDVTGSDALPLVKVGFAKAWRHFFGDDFSPFFRRRVKGFDFLCANWDPATPIDLFSATPDWQMRRLREELAEADTSRPFFYVQHPHLKGTVMECDYVFTHDDGAVTAVLKDYPMAVALSGHSHISLTDDRCFWRGPFTAVGTSALKSANTSAIHDNFESVIRMTGDVPDVRQGMLMSVFPGRIVFERRDFSRGEEVDVPWVSPVPARSVRREDRVEYVQTPRFPDAASVRVVLPQRPGGDGVIEFPQAVENAKTRPYDYEVKVEHSYAGVELTLGMFRVLSSTVVLPKKYDLQFPAVKVALEARHLPKYDLGRVRVTVTALNSLGARGSAISSGWIQVPKV